VRVEEVGSDWGAFSSVFASGTRSLGSPFHGAPFFACLQRHWGPRLTAWVARTAEGSPAAAALSICSGGITHYVYGQNVHALRPTCANSLVVWTMIRHACALGRQAVDLGRSETGSANERFKTQWGGRRLPLHETLMLIWRKRAPDLNPTNPALQQLTSLWSRLPEGLTRRIGPLFIRGIG